MSTIRNWWAKHGRAFPFDDLSLTPGTNSTCVPTKGTMLRRFDAPQRAESMSYISLAKDKKQAWSDGVMPKRGAGLSNERTPGSTVPDGF